MSTDEDCTTHQDADALGGDNEPDHAIAGERITAVVATTTLREFERTLGHGVSI